MNHTQKMIAGGAALVALVAGVAIASSYMTRTAMEDRSAQQAALAAKPAAGPAHRPMHPQTAQARPACDDHNIVGTVGGAVAGGLVGSQFGKGNGKGLATAGGAVAGGALGNAYIPTRGATCD